jgi:hypothetical protein
MASFEFGHPTGVTVDVVGLECGDNGRSCEAHKICGSVVDIDVVLRIRRVQVLVDGKETTALACHWVTDGVDQCRVGFLPKHCIRHSAIYEGKLLQVIEMYKDSDSPSKRKRCHKNKGSCLGVIIDSERREPQKPVSKKQKICDNRENQFDEGEK